MAHQVSVSAPRFLEAVSVAVPLTRSAKQSAKPYPITIRFDDWRKMLRIAEARHGAKGHEVPAEGRWPDKVQIDGRRLRALANKFKPDAPVILTATSAALAVQSGAFKILFDRIDANEKGGIEETDFSKNRRHKGPVKSPPDPVGKRVEPDETWLFSARMPVPQHRKPKE